LVSAPAAEEIKVRDVGLSEGSELGIGNHLGRVIEIPGHTLGHVALVFDDPRMAFVGDTLFAMGCGRLFEGTAQQMHHSLQRIADLPGDTALYCGHEYTLANARFAEHAEPENEAIAVRYERVRAQRERNEITLPTTVSEERETNPFVRATNWEEFARLRAEKDSFRS
jgi:hydroxyacylglutathione hydrolase